MAVAEGPFDESERRMFAKLLLTAGMTPEQLLHADMARGKAALWRALREGSPRVVITLGHAPSKLLLRGDGKFKLSPRVGVFHAADYADFAVVPARHPRQLMRGPMADVAEMVRILLRCKHHDESG